MARRRTVHHVAKKKAAPKKKKTTTKRITIHKAKSTTAKKTTAKKTTTTTKAITGGAVTTALQTDPQAFASLVAQVGSALFSSGFVAEIIQAIEAVIDGRTNRTPGTLLAGTISASGSALQLNGSSQPIYAMVALNGAATLVPAYVPTHLRGSIATGQEVWIMPVNGALDDLIVFSIRNVF